MVKPIFNHTAFFCIIYGARDEIKYLKVFKEYRLF